MMYRSLRIVSVWFAILVWACVACAQDEVKYKELPNFHRINAGLYRGGQPKEGGFERLAALGIKTVINLRDDDKHEVAEEREVRALGLRYFNVPLNDLFGRPSDEQVTSLLSIINAPENQPVFVHCRRGSDRTGTVIAVYRIEHDGWTSEQAKAEAKRYGMGFWVIGMKDYINDYYRRHLLTKAGVSKK
ncbi:MAG TPA: dual specificity protein phosphatase family protein [Pyrinomonadaceae bacterium]|nr:dual specificity protein phosphatase family protein [Pyrinomonadaceae bacterium]